MLKTNQWLLIVIGGTFVLAVAVGALFIGEANVANAAVETWNPANLKNADINTIFAPRSEGFNHPGHNPRPAHGEDRAEFLAQALGISVEELQEALKSAQLSAIEAAVEDGKLTRKQADWMILRGLGYRGLAGGVKAVDFDALLAGELGISVDELQAARDQAFELAIEQNLADGKITEEQADLIRARRALKEYLNRKALLAQALGLSVGELDAAREEGKTISQVLEEQGLTAVEAREALEAAYQAAIQQAVADGVITQVQADLFLERFPNPPTGGLKRPARPGARRDSARTP